MRDSQQEQTPTAEMGSKLLARIARGDRSAMDDFYRIYQGSVFRLINARLNDSFAAADILNEVMLTVWKDAGRFRGDANPVTWLLGISHHKTMDHMRARYRHASEPLDESMPDLDRADLSEVIESAQLGARIRDCIQNLTEKHRAVLHLAFFEEMPYAQIAGVLNCPEGTVKTRIFHAKELVKRCLGGVMP